MIRGEARVRDSRDLSCLRKPAVSAFSLIEIVIAVAIIAFALVGILGLFPVAMDAAKKSQEETQAALIVRSIYADINRDPALLDAPSANLKFDESGKEVEGSSDGKSSNQPVYEATVTVTKDTPISKIATVEVVIAIPAGAPPARQTTYPFVTLIRHE